MPHRPPPHPNPPPDDPLANAIWNALHTTHQHLALTDGLTTRDGTFPAVRAGLIGWRT